MPAASSPGQKPRTSIRKAVPIEDRVVEEQTVPAVGRQVPGIAPHDGLVGGDPAVQGHVTELNHGEALEEG